MNTRTNNSKFHAGDRVSERATRGAMAQFRTAAVRRAPLAARGATKSVGTDRRDLQRPATDPQILRRWKLADLIAAANRRRAFA